MVYNSRSRKRYLTELPLFESIKKEKYFREKNIRIPDEDIKIRYHELIVLNTPTFQRLFRINQLGLAFLIYPYATHTRAAHSLSCLSWAQKIMDSLKKNLSRSNFSEKNFFLNCIEKYETETRLAALLHDVSHIPFSHTLEDENLIFEKHDKSKRLSEIFNNLENDINSLDDFECPQLIFRLSEEEYKKTKKELLERLDKVKKILTLKDKVEGWTDEEKNIYFITDILTNTICADLLSYIEKDPEMAGTGGKPTGVYRLFDYFQIRRDREGKARLVIMLTKEGLPRPDVLAIITELLNKRYILSCQITYHHAKLAASAMLGKIAQLIELKESKELYKIGDEGFFALLEQKINDGLKSTSGTEKRRNFEGAKKLLENLRSRRLHKRFYIIPYDNRNIDNNLYNISDIKKETSSSKGYRKLRSLEKEIEKIGLDPGDVIIFAPKVTFKEVKTMVAYQEPGGTEKVERLNSSGCKEFIKKAFAESSGEEISNLEKKYDALWKLYVFINPEKVRRYGREIYERLDKIFRERGMPQLREYWEKREEFKISNKFYEEIDLENLEKRATTYRKIPELLQEEIEARGKLEIKKLPNDFFKSDLIESLVKKAKKAMDEESK